MTALPVVQLAGCDEERLEHSVRSPKYPGMAPGLMDHFRLHSGLSQLTASPLQYFKKKFNIFYYLFLQMNFASLFSSIMTALLNVALQHREDLRPLQTISSGLDTLPAHTMRRKH